LIIYRFLSIFIEILAANYKYLRQLPFPYMAVNDI
jgi:hypothetical protein